MKFYGAISRSDQMSGSVLLLFQFGSFLCSFGVEGIQKKRTCFMFTYLCFCVVGSVATTDLPLLLIVVLYLLLLIQHHYK